MGGLSITHLLIFLVIILIFFGPSKLPGLGKSLGEAIKGFKKGLNDNEIDVTTTSREKLHSGETQAQSQKVEEKDRV